MTHTMKTTALAAGLLLAIMAAPGSQADSPPDAANATGSESRSVAPFSAIVLNGPFRVIVTAQGERSVELSGPRRQFADISTTVAGDTLTIGQPRRKNKGWSFNFSFGKNREQPPMTIRISAAGLKSLRNSGSGDVDIEQLQAQQFTLMSEGPGDVRASGAVRELTVNASGSGDLELGMLKAGSLTLRMSGPGDVNASGITQDLNAVLSGSGDLDIGDMHANKVNAVLRGPGSASLRGSATEIRAELSGSGDLDACSLNAEAVSTVLRGPGEACFAGTIKQFDAEVHGSGDLTVRGLQAPTMRAVIDGPGNMRLSGSAGALSARLGGSGDLDGRALSASQADVVVRGPGSAVLNLNERQADGRSRLVTYERSGTRERASN